MHFLFRMCLVAMCTLILLGVIIYITNLLVGVLLLLLKTSRKSSSQIDPLPMDLPRRCKLAMGRSHDPPIPPGSYFSLLEYPVGGSASVD